MAVTLLYAGHKARMVVALWNHTGNFHSTLLQTWRQRRPADMAPEAQSQILHSTVSFGLYTHVDYPRHSVQG